jgi:ABC-type Fe3+/spermidine/putrescine transport system ATPase subunit
MSLEIQGLTVRYGGVAAVDRLDLTVLPGELFVLLGGSGSGKTTLLRTIGGFLKPSSGQMRLDGVNLLPLPPHRRPVNTMFQSYALFPNMTVAANVAFGLRGRGAAARVAEMLALVRLDGFEARKPAELSGGQQQRVALARSLAPNPRLLLLDEPLSALDQGLRAETRAELVRLQRQVGTSFILVTHDQQEALTMADRIGVMAGGKLAQVGTPAEVYERPVSRFVAEFLGAANVLTGTLRTEGFVLPDGDLVRCAMQAPIGPGLLAVRPERMRLGDGTNRLSGVLDAQAYAGETLVSTVRLPDGTILRASQSLHNGVASARLPPGTAVTLGWEPEACILLPP